MNSKNNYCFLKGTVISSKSTTHGNPHYDLKIKDNNKTYTVNVNVKSRVKPTDLKYYVEEKINNPIVNRCLKLNDGIYTNLITGNDGECLDYIRGSIIGNNIFKLAPDHDEDQVSELEAMLDNAIKPILNNSDFSVGIWGMSYDNNTSDAIIGVHDVHMNQGNDKNFENENGIWQDGGLAIFDNKNQFVKVLYCFAFQSQCTNTDDKGNCK